MAKDRDIEVGRPTSHSGEKHTFSAATVPTMVVPPKNELKPTPALSEILNSAYLFLKTL